MMYFGHPISKYLEKKNQPRALSPNLTSMGKSALESDKYRKQGNQLYLEKNYSEALNAYGKSVLFAPDSSESLAYAYGNRSAVFCELKLFKHGLRDIQRALSCRGCPNGLKQRLLTRQEKCEAEKSDEPVELTLDGESFMYQDVIDEIPEVEGEPNAKLPSVTRKVTLEYDPVVGRRLVATETIDIGSVIIVEQPYAATLLGSKLEHHCNGCLDILPYDFVPCPQCTEVKLCSEACLKKESKDHSWECGLLDGTSTELELLLMQLPHKVFAATPAKDLAEKFSCQHHASIDQPSSEGVYGLNDNEIYNGGYQCLWNLTTHHAERKCNNVQLSKEIIQSAEKLSNSVRSDGRWPKMVDELFEYSSKVCDECKSASDDRKAELARAYVTSTFERIIEIIICNSHGVIDQDKIGMGIYPTASLINHSCVPNAFLSFVKNIMVVRATKTIEAGEEIRHCYGPRYGQQLVHERKKTLKEQYHFDCFCIGCTEPEFVEKEKLFTAVNCKQCPKFQVDYQPGVFYSQESVNICWNPMIKGGDHYVCPTCSAQVPASPIETSKQEIVSALDRCIGSSDRPSTEAQEAEVSKLLSSLTEILAFENKELSEWRIKTAKWILKRNPDPKWLAILEQEVSMKALRFGENSMELAYDIHGFMEAAMKASEKREDGLKTFIFKGGARLFKLCRQGIEIFGTFFGSNSQMSKELNNSTVTLLSKCFTPEQGGI